MGRPKPASRASIAARRPSIFPKQCQRYKGKTKRVKRGATSTFRCIVPSPPYAGHSAGPGMGPAAPCQKPETGYTSLAWPKSN